MKDTMQNENHTALAVLVSQQKGILDSLGELKASFAEHCRGHWKVWLWAIPTFISLIQLAYIASTRSR